MTEEELREVFVDMFFGKGSIKGKMIKMKVGDIVAFNKMLRVFIKADNVVKRMKKAGRMAKVWAIIKNH